MPGVGWGLLRFGVIPVNCKAAGCRPTATLGACPGAVVVAIPVVGWFVVVVDSVDTSSTNAATPIPIRNTFLLVESAQVNH
jgi:hypothetical protein